MIGSKIEAFKPPRNDLKVVSVTEMTLLYDTWYSVVLLRPKHEVKLLTQSAEKWICVGKWPVSNLPEFIHHVLVVPCAPEFFSQRGRFPSSGKIKLQYKTTRGRGQKIKTRI